MAEKRADLQGKKVLFIAYFYPPTESTGVPGSMRTVKFIRHLENGECHVLTAPEGVTPEADALAHISLPVNGEKIHRVASWDVFRLLLVIRSGLRRMLGKGKPSGQSSSAAAPPKSAFKSDNDSASVGRSQQFKDFIYNLCYFPDQAGPWIIPAFLKGRKLVRQSNLDVIFATGSPWSGLITGYLISKSTGKPLVVDFRDPWVNNPFHQSKGELLDRWGARLEKKVVNHAAAVSLNTEPLMEEFLQRYPELNRDKFFVMPNGFDNADFEKVEPDPRDSKDSDIVLCHAGFLYGVRDPAALLDAIRHVNNTRNANALRLIFQQIGNVELDYNLSERYQDMIKEGTLILDPPKGYLKCIKTLKAADVVVNVQPATKSQIPSKLYDYLAINRPIISLTPPDGALGKLIATKHLGQQADFHEKELLIQILKDLVAQHTTERFFGYENRNQFDVSEISKLLSQRINSSTS
jgi:hypothetical protein